LSELALLGIQKFGNLTPAEAGAGGKQASSVVQFPTSNSAPFYQFVVSSCGYPSNRAITLVNSSNW
jgi:hypothetical protein